MAISDRTAQAVGIAAEVAVAIEDAVISHALRHDKKLGLQTRPQLREVFQARIANATAVYCAHEVTRATYQTGPI